MFRIALKYLRGRLFATVLTITSLALGIGMITTLFIVVGGFTKALDQTNNSFPIAVGAEGSPYQLVISSVFHIDLPSGSIDYSWYEKYRKDERISRAVPIILGHSFKQRPVIATTRSYFSEMDQNIIDEGRFFEKGADEVIIGARVARELHLAPGAVLQWQQGKSVRKKLSPPLKIVGILKQGFGYDDSSIFTSIDTIFRLHKDVLKENKYHNHQHEAKGLSAILIQPKDPSTILDLAREIGDEPHLQAVLVQRTISKIYELFGGGIAILTIIMYLAIYMAILTFLVSMYSSINEYRGDIAIMRAIGAQRSIVSRLVFLQSLIVILTGLVIGWILGHVLGFGIAYGINCSYGLLIDIPLFTLGELKMFGAVLLFGTISGFIPAITAYQSEPFENLTPSVKKIKSIGAKIKVIFFVLITVGLVYSIFGAMGSQFRTLEVPQLSTDAIRFYTMIDSWNGKNTIPVNISKIKGKEITVEGYIYTASNPTKVRDFFLVEENPLLPHCPICYKPPRLNNMVQILTNDKQIDYTRYPIKVLGTFEVGTKTISGYQSLYRLKMKSFQVMSIN